MIMPPDVGSSITCPELVGSEHFVAPEVLKRQVGPRPTVAADMLRVDAYDYAVLQLLFVTSAFGLHHLLQLEATETDPLSHNAVLRSL